MCVIDRGRFPTEAGALKALRRSMLPSTDQPSNEESVKQKSSTVENTVLILGLVGWYADLRNAYLYLSTGW